MMDKRWALGVSDLQRFNEQFAIADQVQFISGKNGMPMVCARNHLGRASIALQGAHVLDFQAATEQPLIWMSRDATFSEGKSLRGGIPVCWPWFGSHESDAAMPSHGYVRTSLWRPVATASLNDGSNCVTMELDYTEAMHRFCAHPLRVQLHVTVGSSLSLTLETSNLGKTPFKLSEALHTYFLVGDIRQARIEGLDGCSYLDKVDHYRRKEQAGALTITSETDRIYLDTNGQCSIVDPMMGRNIDVTSEGSASTVVWNPWIGQAAKMGDLGKDGYLTMLCVETANVAGNAITIAAGATHRLSASYSTSLFFADTHPQSVQ